MTDTTDKTSPPRRKIPVLVLLPLVVFGLLAVLFFVQLRSGKDTSAIPSALIDKSVPEFVLPALDGLERDGAPVPGLASADLKGRVSVVNIFASWCAPCRAEHPLLMDLARDDRIALTGINYKDKGPNARRFLGSLGNPYERVGVDENGRAAIDWGVYGVPETFIIGADGRIRYKFIGPLSPQSYRSVFLPQLEKVLAATP
ncbi:DsbE family thiol:disulfide interchange protein [Breoghania sp. L-A4]|uniref:DsbE family thiol:disulfide interchange protein n=1 Tax=Breoghania sp. L-A4 TaxID=2304600 RepID=UPI000E35877B|nr:DsbE family thiol:disulfide interchange protein [Breoghania sp. L-A4]AXS38917.1 DsbE family thiol:disulfide interchange protein [Breoghania sp. L-A4]